MFLPSGCSKVCSSCTRISDKVPGKLGGLIHQGYQNSSECTRRNVARSRLCTSSQNAFQNSPSEPIEMKIKMLRQNTPELDSEHSSSEFPVSSMFIFLWYPSIALRETVPCRYQPFCRSLVACWTAGNSDAVLCFCQPSSVNLALNAVKLPWFLLEQTKHLTSVGDIHDPCPLTCLHHVPCHNVTAQHQAKQRLAAVPAFSFCRSLVARWTAWNSDALVCFCQPSSLDLCWTPWNFVVFMLKQATQHHRHLITMFHATTQLRGQLLDNQQHRGVNVALSNDTSKQKTDPRANLALCVWEALEQSPEHPAYANNANIRQCSWFLITLAC